MQYLCPKCGEEVKDSFCTDHACTVSAPRNDDRYGVKNNILDSAPPKDLFSPEALKQVQNAYNQQVAVQQQQNGCFNTLGQQQQMSGMGYLTLGNATAMTTWGGGGGGGAWVQITPQMIESQPCQKCNEKAQMLQTALAEIQTLKDKIAKSPENPYLLGNSTEPSKK